MTAGDRMSLAVNILERPVFLQPITSFHSLSFRFSAESSLYEEKPAHGQRAGLIHNHTDFGFPAVLHRQLFAAAAAAGSQNPAAVLGRHPGTEAVYLAALALLGLVRTEHSQHSSQSIGLTDPGGPLFVESLYSIQNLQSLVKHSFEISCVIPAGKPASSPPAWGKNFCCEIKTL